MAILFYGLQVALVGMGVVFCALVILIGMIKGMDKVLERIKNAGSPMAALKGAGKAPAAGNAPSIIIQTANVNDDAVVAAISAAIMTVIEDEVKQNPEKAKSTFVVRSIRRVSNAPAWNRAGREEQVYSRM